jgi:hypothetical protein
MTTHSLIPTWIYQAYLYIVGIIALLICIIGSVTIVNLTIRTAVFGVTDSWYENPAETCQYEVLDSEDRKSIYPTLADCIAAKQADKAMRAKHDLARDISQGTAMVLVGFPIYWYHWRKIQVLQKA